MSKTLNPGTTLAKAACSVKANSYSLQRRQAADGDGASREGTPGRSTSGCRPLEKKELLAVDVVLRIDIAEKLAVRREA